MGDCAVLGQESTKLDLLVLGFAVSTATFSSVRRAALPAPMISLGSLLVILPPTSLLHPPPTSTCYSIDTASLTSFFFAESRTRNKCLVNSQQGEKEWKCPQLIPSRWWPHSRVLACPECPTDAQLLHGDACKICRHFSLDRGKKSVQFFSSRIHLRPGAIGGHQTRSVKSTLAYGKVCSIHRKSTATLTCPGHRYSSFSCQSLPCHTPTLN